ncbi:phospholipid--sterol O-acyltransferase isoform X1 [Herrania umbratica]|uniref:Phospholipid--sterol O-acyltransferase isoform X1 n=1 Tax=Herrania umbratica TaxID=108875 RepID=A0A6J1A2C9_9ROSI|nr:phospholipid--sterol O-acyltransferase isoform X1 [Herrania umbratica]XP_021281131.1 phospholipid--sterol O-acyltransferase isoform X1 [Herrania umbratica]XP_021281132.1 phospholipid--sterol O-acyltransferase isoform X1 [Herrania umbratica]XP_021281133.1 phospholipid--sterol O-acyltransferase isoform X1 [Herrania umbratica]
MGGEEQQRRRLAIALAAVLLLGTFELSEGEFSGDYSKLSGIIIPGFASTQLRAWSILDCPYSPLDFNPLDLVWLDTTKLLSAVNCWLKCMLLDPYNQTDHPECKSRPDSGLSAITELDPGYITGPLSSVWKEWVKWCIEFGIEANAIIAVPYDWRLPPSLLEERDLYFHKLKLTFETALKLRGGPSVVFAHSLGNHVFRYFLEWLKLEIAPKQYIQWLDEHIYAYFAVGAPLLGAIETVKAALSGNTFGLPVSEGTARLMFNSFGSSLWMMPFSKYCRADGKYLKHFSGGIRKDHHTYQCEQEEFHSNYSGWPTNIINIEIPSIRGFDAYPSVSEFADTNLSSMECGLPTQLSFSAREISDGTFFKAIEDYDPDSKRILHQLKKSYHDDPVLNPFTPWDRPPIKNVFCIYGIDSKTEVGYYFAPSGKPYPDNWIITDVIYEIEGSLISRSGNQVEGNPGPASGDETVPYHSLSWCKNWLGQRVNITRAPQSEHDGSDVQVELNVEHHYEQDIVPNMTRSPRVKYITYYEDSESIPGQRTAVWELDKANHRNIVRSPVLMRELWLQIWHDIHLDTKSNFVTKAKRGPLRNEDCYWDYGKARCAWPEYCEYRYVFGDVHLGQSCRLRNSSADTLLHYV